MNTDEAHAIAVQGDGKVVVGGFAAAGSGLGTDLSSDFTLARYLGG